MCFFLHFVKRESFGSVESVKAASDVYSPVSGEVVEINDVRRVLRIQRFNMLAACVETRWLRSHRVVSLNDPFRAPTPLPTLISSNFPQKRVSSRGGVNSCTAFVIGRGGRN